MKNMKRQSRKKVLFILAVLLFSLTACDWNLYTSTGLITPTITITSPAVTRTGSSFNLLSIAPEGIPSSYSITVPANKDYTILKGQSADSTERFIEALSYLKKTGQLDKMLKSKATGETADAVLGTLAFSKDTLDSLKDSINGLDKALQQILEILSGVGIEVEITFFSDMAGYIEDMAESLSKENITVADYITLQYYIDILSSVLRLSVPIINIVSQTGSSLTLEEIESIVSGDGLSSELQGRIADALKNNSTTLLGILIDALSSVDQTGRLLDNPALPDIAALLRLITGGNA